jgi:hypothetical protein
MHTLSPGWDLWIFSILGYDARHLRLTSSCYYKCTLIRPPDPSKIDQALTFSTRLPSRHRAHSSLQLYVLPAKKTVCKPDKFNCPGRRPEAVRGGIRIYCFLFCICFAEKVFRSSSNLTVCIFISLLPRLQVPSRKQAQLDMYMYSALKKSTTRYQ